MAENLMKKVVFVGAVLAATFGIYSLTSEKLSFYSQKGEIDRIYVNDSGKGIPNGSYLSFRRQGIRDLCIPLPLKGAGDFFTYRDINGDGKVDVMFSSDRSIDPFWRSSEKFSEETFTTLDIKFAYGVGMAQINMKEREKGKDKEIIIVPVKLK